MFKYMFKCYFTITGSAMALETEMYFSNLDKCAN